MNEILDLLTDVNAERIAEDIVIALEEEANKDNIDFDFNVKEGKMQRIPITNSEIESVLREIHETDVPSPNTWFSFDTKLNSMLGFLKDTVCRLMDSDKITDKEYLAVRNFIPRIIRCLNSNQKLVDRLRKVLRKIILNTDDEIFFPLTEAKLLLFEFGEKEDYADMIKVFNYARVDAATGKFLGEKNAIAADLLKRRREFGYSRGQNSLEIYTKIIHDQKEAQNPIYKDILPGDLHIVSEAKECHLDLFIDYSPISKEEILARTVSSDAPSRSLP